MGSGFIGFAGKTGIATRGEAGAQQWHIVAASQSCFFSLSF
jgi:hypothetical protein